ncbi:MAG: AI-2E family transporter, partial [Planctomycetes bacterium]|nr:AI-2E family transporter [Planctomycetota bacterium]
RLASMAVVGVLTAVGLLVLGVPLALGLAILAALLSFVPFLGPVVSAVPAVLVAFVESPTLALWVVGLYGAVQLVETYLVTPFIQQRAVSLPPSALLAAQILMGIMGGILGILLATPLAVSHTLAPSRRICIALLSGAIVAGGLAGLASQAHATCGDYLIVGDARQHSANGEQAMPPSHGDPAAPDRPGRTPCRGPQCSSGSGPLATPTPAPQQREQTSACILSGEQIERRPPRAAIPDETPLLLPPIARRLLRPPR